MSKRERNNPISMIVFSLVALVCIVPLLYILAVSFSSSDDIANYGYQLIPKHISLDAYSYIFKYPELILNSYRVSIIVTVFGTILGVMLTFLLAYPMSRKDYRYHKALTILVIVPLLIQGGLVPWYIEITRYLHLADSIFVLILPYCLSPWFVMLAKGFLGTIPFDIIESAKIDGANEISIFFKMILPLSKAGIATIALFYAFMYWNDWWLALLYINNPKLIPLQYMLYTIMADIQALAMQMTATGQAVDLSSIPTESVRFAMCVLAAVPMMIVFPFFQKYFVKGLVVGSVKG